VLALGSLAAQSLLQSGEPLGRLRGRALPGPQGLPVIASYHPAYLLRNPADKARAWADLCLAAEHSQTPPL
jgi:DNA polymerase